MRHPTILLGVVAASALSVLAGSAGAQGNDRAERERARARVFVRGDADENRPVIGVSTSSSGERDTLGLLVVSVTPGGPADQAGIEEGNRIAAVNGTNLRLAPADAGERDMQGMTTRRLVRELGKVEPGAEVELRVWQNGSYRNVKVKTVAAEDLPGRRRTTEEERENRGVLGLRLGGGGSRRDTLGILVIGLTPDGPAEKAGLVEGDRIEAIGNVDLRVPAADAGDRWASSTRVNRFMRELRELKPGQSVALRVRSGGQTRTVNITAVAAKDLEDEHGGMFFFGDNFGFDAHTPMPAIAPMAPMPPMPPMIEMAPKRMRTPRAIRVPRIPETVLLELDGLDIELPAVEELLDAEAWTVDADAAKRAEEVLERLREASEAVEAREREVREREARVRASERGLLRSTSWSSDAGSSVRVAAAPAVARSATLVTPAPARTGNTLSLPGLTLSLVNRDLAAYFGPGAERGILVLAADGRWDGLREGDVILAVDGKTTEGFSCVSNLAKGDRSIVVLRDGRRTTMKVNGKG